MRTLFAFLGGAVAGAAIALLLAPEKGEVTRGKIRNMVDHGIDEVEKKAQAIRRKTNKTSRVKIATLAEAAKDKL